MSESADGTRRAIEILDERIDYLDGYTPRDKSHEQRLDERAMELRIVKERLKGEDE